jgi:hypothetical protein
MNKYFYEKLVSLSSGIKSDKFEKLTKRAQYLSSLAIDSDEKMEKYLLVKNAALDIGAGPLDEEIKRILNLNIKNKNDAYYVIVKARLNSKGIKKLAYPSHGLSPDDIGEEYNVGAWLDLVYKIYNSVESGEMSKENALEYYSNSLDIKEKDSFLKWFEYYSAGEHLKYSLEEELDMKKKAIYQAGLVSSPYSADRGNNMPGSSFDGGRRSFEEASNQAGKNSEEKGAFSTWKQQLYGAIRRVDKLIRSDRYVDHEEYSDLSEALKNLSILAKKVKLARTLSDITYKTASTFERAGVDEVAGILKKIAQEVPSDEEFTPEPQAEAAPAEPVQPQELPAEAIPTPELPEEEEATPSPSDASGVQVPETNEVEPVKFKDIMPMPGAKPNEYAELAGDISLETAAAKLDEVAGMLADRRIIRQLAEFDIMLDKIGIASMFPELAESQSKLIDSFSYALTRVTKMMGQLANAKTLVDAGAGAGVPGEAAPETESEEPEITPENLEAEEPAELPGEPAESAELSEEPLLG